MSVKMKKMFEGIFDDVNTNKQKFPYNTFHLVYQTSLIRKAQGYHDQLITIKWKKKRYIVIGCHQK
jgi:hypothetical protein